MRIKDGLMCESLRTKMADEDLLALLQNDAVLDEKMFVQIILKFKFEIRHEIKVKSTYFIQNWN